MAIRELESFADNADGRVGAGWQCLVDLHGCGTQKLDNIEWVRGIMMEAAHHAGAIVVGEHFHRFDPHGISGVVIIAESHLAVHIWPERAFAAVDFFTCSSQLELSAAVAWLADAFSASDRQIRYFVRGDRSAGIINCDGGFAALVSPQSTRDFVPDNLYIEQDDATGGHWFLCDRTVESAETPFQKIEIMDFAHFGRALALDGRLQSAESDEYIYHEALVQPALCIHGNPKHVLIIGGGEGATAREALKHDSVEKVVMADIDGKLLDLARKHLEPWHRNSFDDPRLQLHIKDGYAFVDTTEERFDVAILDVVDSFDGSPAEALFSVDFFRLLKERLLPGGILVVQAMEFYTGEYADHLRVRQNLDGLFRHVRSYVTFVPSYRSMWGFVIATDGADPACFSATAIDCALRRRGVQGKLRFYDGITHQALFALYKDIRGLINEA